MDAERGGAVSKRIKEGTQFAILLFATAWGVYTFVYKETILPARRPATLTVTTSLEELGRTDEMVLIRLRIHAVNRTDRKIYAPAVWYSVGGLRLSRLTGEEYRAQVADAPATTIHARFSAITESDVVAVGTLYKSGTTYFEPTDEDTNEVLFEVPLDRSYDALQVWSQCFLTKDLDGLALAGWDVGEHGELNPQLVVFGRPYDPQFDPQHHAWALSAGAGFYDSTSTLSLWAKPAIPQPPASAEPRVATRPPAGPE